MVLFRKLPGSKHLSPVGDDGIFSKGNTRFQDSQEWSDVIDVTLFHLINQAHIRFSKAKTYFTCITDGQK